MQLCDLIVFPPIIDAFWSRYFQTFLFLVVIGPPGSGKSTYCSGIQQFLTLLGRKTVIINLDPANENLPYQCHLDIQELISIENVMKEFQLGPNGSLIYCMEYLLENIDWFQKKLEGFKDCYILFDFPGQIELFTVHESVRKLVDYLQEWDWRITAVHLIDAHYCSDPSKYLSALLVSLSTMIRLELPHVNVLSKIDMIESYGKLDFDLEYYTDVQNLSYIMDHFKDSKFQKLNEALAGIIEDFSLVSFMTLNISDKKSVNRLIQLIDKTNGYIYSNLERETLKNMVHKNLDLDLEKDDIHNFLNEK